MFAESGTAIVAGTGGALTNVRNIPQDKGKTDSSVEKKEIWLQGRQRLVFSFLSEVEAF